MAKVSSIGQIELRTFGEQLPKHANVGIPPLCSSSFLLPERSQFLSNQTSTYPESLQILF